MLPKTINTIPTQNIRRNTQKESLSDLEHSDTSSDYSNFIDFPNSKINIIDIIKIRNFIEKKIKEKADLIKEKNLSIQQKILITLNECNSSSESIDLPEPGTSKESNNDNYNNSSFFDDVSTADLSSYSSVQLDDKNKYYIEYKLYDYITNCNKSKESKLPQIKQLDQDKIYYLYLNKLITYYFTMSANLGNNKPINYEVYDSDECKLNELYGLFFCGKIIEYNNETTICGPNKMICKKCMEKNKKRYNLKDKYLININGRAAKRIKDGDKGFRCFGHFFFGKIQIEICNKFCCMGCQLLNNYANYYFSK